MLAPASALPTRLRLPTWAVRLAAIAQAAVILTQMLARPASADPLAVGVHLLAFGSALALAYRPPTRLAAMALAFYWLGRFPIELGEAMAGADGAPAWIAPAEALTLACAAAAIAFDTGSMGARQSRAALQGAVSIMLLLFGYIHATDAATIAGLIPAWFPLPAVAPYATAAVMMLAGAALWVPRVMPAAICGVVAMFVAWLPVVHAPHLAATPADVGEWVFAAMALALAGSLLVLLATSPARRPG